MPKFTCFFFFFCMQLEVELSRECHEGDLKEKYRLARVMEHKMELEEKVVSRQKAELNKLREEEEARKREEAERRKKEEAKRRAKLDEIAERQRKREQELEERERLRKECNTA
uniref:Uncharacterized protein n=1 Tax=Lactuca sativa TaxID=4236 RepID=A0A9R1VR21_LACSA|nr:hypothetical protein LSAT_V11C400226740 [Lactuca sativa]